MVFADAPVRVARAAIPTAVALVVVVSLIFPPIGWVPAATVLMIGGKDQSVLSDAEMASMLNGRYAGAGDTRVSVKWPAQAWPLSGAASLTVGESVMRGIEELEKVIGSTSGPTVVLGVSEGSLVVDAVMRRLADSNGERAEELSFVTVAALNRGNGILTHFTDHFIPVLNYTPRPEPETPYDVIVVAQEYDGWADFPDRPWNLLATLNAVAGSGLIPGFPSLHNATLSADLSQIPKTNITTTVNSIGGATTTYLVPSPDLPLLQPLRDWGVPKPVVDAINNALKPVVDAGYRRNDPPRAPGSLPSTDVIRESPDSASNSVAADNALSGSNPAESNARPTAAHDSASKRDVADRTNNRTQTVATADKRLEKTRGGCAAGRGCSVTAREPGELAQRRAPGLDSRATASSDRATASSDTASSDTDGSSGTGASGDTHGAAANGGHSG